VRLIVIEGQAARPSYEVEGARTLIGRAPDCDVLIFDIQVSRYHAQLMRNGDELVIESLQQTNPVIVNDAVVAGRQAVIDGDLIIVGGVLFEVDIPPPTLVPPEALHQPRQHAGQPAPRRIEERLTPHVPPAPHPTRPPVVPPPRPLEIMREVSARLAEAGQRMQTLATTQPSTSPVSDEDTRAVDAIVAEHERLGGDAELARLAALLSERLSNQTDIRGLYRLGAEAGALIAWSRIARRSIDTVTHLADVLGAR
jgi:hypothetical protein